MENESRSLNNDTVLNISLSYRDRLRDRFHAALRHRNFVYELL